MSEAIVPANCRRRGHPPVAVVSREQAEANPRARDSATMLQMTAQPVADPNRLTVRTSWARRAIEGEIAAQLRAVGAKPALLILGPRGRNTAAAIALTALESAREALLLVMPSDDVIGRPDLIARLELHAPDILSAVRASPGLLGEGAAAYSPIPAVRRSSLPVH